MNNKEITLLSCPWCLQPPSLTVIKDSPANPELVGCDNQDCPLGHCVAMTPSDWNNRAEMKHCDYCNAEHIVGDGSCAQERLRRRRALMPDYDGKLKEWLS